MVNALTKEGAQTICKIANHGAQTATNPLQHSSPKSGQIEDSAPEWMARPKVLDPDGQNPPKSILASCLDRARDRPRQVAHPGLRKQHLHLGPALATKQRKQRQSKQMASMQPNKG